MVTVMSGRSSLALLAALCLCAPLCCAWITRRPVGLQRVTRRTGSSRSATRMAAEERRVVVTGLGVISGVGMDQESFYMNLLEGASGISTVSRFDPSDFTCQIAAQVPDSFDGSAFFQKPKTARSNDRYTHFGVAATKLALEDAELDLSSVDAERVGVLVGSAFGGMETYEAQTLKLAKSGPRGVSPYTIPALLSNTAAGIIGIETGAKGPNFGLASACATASHAIGEAMAAIKRGDADVMIAGGTEAAVTPTSFAGFCSMKAMATQYNDDPSQGSRPFDADRCGFVMGEGAGVIIIESLEHAVKRGADVYCELAGYGASCDAYHITSPAPEGEGLGRAMNAALSAANMEPSEVTYLNAHGTSTNYNDKFETMAIKGAFGDHAKDLYISSIKGSTGHTLGAAGGLEAIACAKAIKTGTIPPTINYKTPDPECDLFYTPNDAKKDVDVHAAISTNLGFGGHNAAVLFKKVES